LTVTVGELLEAGGAALQLRLAAGARGLDRRIALPRLQQPGLALAGYLPQLHPHRVQVLGNSEVSYLGTLEPARARAAVAAVAGGGVACFVVTNGNVPPPMLVEAAEAAGVAVLASGLRTADLIRAATVWLEERMAPEAQLHGDLVELHGLGVLILGKSGIGKSEAALDLVSRGHRLVADDVVLVRRISPGVLRGKIASSRIFASGKSFDCDWVTVKEEDLPSQEDVLACIDEMKGKTRQWLAEMDFDCENKEFVWAGKTKLGVVLFLLRHSLFHIGELSSLLNESRNGEVEDHYVKALSGSW
jgi:hypothetical protein